MKYYLVVDSICPEGDLYRFSEEEGLEMKATTGRWIKSCGSSVQQLTEAVEEIGGTVTEVSAP